MSFNKKFLENEVRLGFYIPSKIKQAWAAELEVLQALDELCTKYGIRYFADWGTLLGVVRHGGFIPWDDDLDIVMFRPDYDRFIEVSNELPEEYRVHTFRNEEGFEEFHAVVQNSEYANFTAEHMRSFHGFAYIAGIDIFILDYIYTDEEAENDRIERLKYIIAVADSIKEGKLFGKSVDECIKKIEKDNHIKVARGKDKKDQWIKLYEAAEKVCAEVKPAQSNKVTQIVPWGILRLTDKVYSAKDYDEIINMPFEYTTIPVPISYDRMLERRYGEYHILDKNAGAHGYPFFDEQKRQLQAVLDFEMPEYKYMQPEPVGDSVKSIVTECLYELSLYKESITHCNRNDETEVENILSCIANAQTLAIDMGNLIEQQRGEGCTSIDMIEKYCESLFALYNCINDGNDISGVITDFEISHEVMEKAVRDSIINTRMVIFIPFSPDSIKQLRPFINKERENGNTDILFMPVPYYYKDYDGALIGDEIYEKDGYPNDITITDYRDIVIEALNPDVIYFQNPYDNYDPVMSVHPDYYSDRLRLLTDKLVYIPWFETNEFDESENRSYQNMKEYVAVPGVVNSDVVYVQSENIRSMYIKKLSEWAGAKTQAVWEEKIIAPSDLVKPENEKIHAAGETEKTIMYYIGDGLLIKHSKECIQKLTCNLKIIRENNPNIRLILTYDKTLFSNLKILRPEIVTQIEDLIKQYQNTDNCEVYIRNADNTIYKDKQVVQRCDAYYGDVGALTSMFMVANKPVMIQNWSNN